MSSVAPRPSKAMFWTGWALSGLIGGAMLFGAVMNFNPSAETIKATEEMGIPGGALFGIGVALFVSALLYLIPQTAVLGAILLTGYFGGAVMTHVRIPGDEWTSLFAITAGVLTWLGLWFREPRLRELAPLRRL